MDLGANGKIFAVILLGAAAPSVAQVTPSLSTLAECRLNYEQAEALMKPLMAISSKDNSDDEADDYVDYYAAQSVRPFGLQATEFSRAEYEDDYDTDHTFAAKVTARYDAAVKAMLSAYRLSACASSSGAAGGRICRLAMRTETGKYKHRISMVVDETATGATLRCFYTD